MEKCFFNCTNTAEFKNLVIQNEECDKNCFLFQDNPLEEFICLKDCAEIQKIENLESKNKKYNFLQQCHIQCLQFILEQEKKIEEYQQQLNEHFEGEMKSKEKSLKQKLKEQVKENGNEIKNKDSTQNSKQKKKELEINEDQLNKNLYNETFRVNIKDKKQEIQNLILNYIKDPYSHPGTSFKNIDCSQNPKKKVYIKRGNFHKMIVNYFENRCDFQIIDPSDINTNDFYFRWADYHYQHNWDQFQPQKQILNHIPNLRALLSDKDGIYKTLIEYDKLNIYDFNSEKFHFKTYIFNLNSSTYNDDEKQFIKDPINGYWLAKDPDGSLGLGIQLFRGTQEIKKNIQMLKQNPDNSIKKQRNIVMYSVIQKYLHNPLLWDGYKFDLRGYILIPSVSPFVVLYQNGFVRKCIEKYDLDFKFFKEQEAFKHLTNRVYQQKHKNYAKHQEDLLVSPPNFDNFLRDKIGFNEQQLSQFHEEAYKVVAYTIASSREKLIKNVGNFQLMGVDLIWDENKKPYLIEINTSAGLYSLLQSHRYIIPQLVQSTLDLILESHEGGMQNLWNYWKNQDQIELGKWNVLYNEANGYDILKSHENKNRNEDL